MIRAAAVAVLMAAMCFAEGAFAQRWSPQRNVEVIVPSSAGGSLDTTGRTITRIWSDLKLLTVSSSISNRPGGGHAVAYNFLAQRAGDPHIMAVTSMTLLANHITGHIPQTYTDFTPLSVLLTEYIAIAVRAESPLKTGKDLIDALRKAPNSLSLALSSAAGGTHHMSFAMPLLSGGVDVTKAKFVVFNSSGEKNRSASFRMSVVVRICSRSTPTSRRLVIPTSIRPWEWERLNRTRSTPPS